MYSRGSEFGVPCVPVADLFASAGLSASTPLPWGSEIGELGPGVYVIAVELRVLDVTYLPPDELAHWNRGQVVIYVGRTGRALGRRLSEFYKHRHGDKAPHRGGQAVKLLRCPLWVHCAATPDHRSAEHRMIEAFRTRVGRRPFANRRREMRTMISEANFTR